MVYETFANSGSSLSDNTSDYKSRLENNVLQGIAFVGKSGGGSWFIC